MSKEIVTPVGWRVRSSFSPAVVAGGLVFVSGQTGVDPATGALAEGGTVGQTRQALRNVETVLRVAGSSLDRVVKVVVYLRNMADFSEMNRVYREFFPDDPPARTTVGVSGLAREDLLVEVDVVALS